MEGKSIKNIKQFTIYPTYLKVYQNLSLSRHTSLKINQAPQPYKIHHYLPVNKKPHTSSCIKKKKKSI